MVDLPLRKSSAILSISFKINGIKKYKTELKIKIPIVKALRILEINPNHDVFKAIEKVYEADKDSLAKYANLLYTQALLMEGILPDNPKEFANSLCELMVNSIK